MLLDMGFITSVIVHVHFQDCQSVVRLLRRFHHPLRNQLVFYVFQRRALLQQSLFLFRRTENKLGQLDAMVSVFFKLFE